MEQGPFDSAQGLHKKWWAQNFTDSRFMGLENWLFEKRLFFAGIVGWVMEKVDPNYKAPPETVITLTGDDFDSVVNSAKSIVTKSRT